MNVAGMAPANIAATCCSPMVPPEANPMSGRAPVTGAAGPPIIMGRRSSRWPGPPGWTGVAAGGRGGPGVEGRWLGP